VDLIVHNLSETKLSPSGYHSGTGLVRSGSRETPPSKGERLHPFLRASHSHTEVEKFKLGRATAAAQRGVSEGYGETKVLELLRVFRDGRGQPGRFEKKSSILPRNVMFTTSRSLAWLHIRVRVTWGITVATYDLESGN